MGAFFDTATEETVANDGSSGIQSTGPSRSRIFSSLVTCINATRGNSPAANSWEIFV